ncbi:hypothetical protein KCP75_24915 [Salmonella enterica subsp. enterica]|nr:hypothetical protein KCP75_24915 [Salmonella enterica subsp. enterica]
MRIMTPRRTAVSHDDGAGALNADATEAKLAHAQIKSRETKRSGVYCL